MLIKYYNNKDLVYTNRKRYRKLSFTHFYEEEQKSVLLGDGATTTIKTKKSNICNYVTIDDTRWYVTSYHYLNGGQVQLNLQRDVIGEFGISGCFGKIERGFTDNFLKYRKELSLNQILKERKKLIPSTNIYGNYTVNNHENEMWGIIYLINSNGEAININIPELAPKTVDYDFISNGSKEVVGYEYDISIYLNVRLVDNRNITIGKYRVELGYDPETGNAFSRFEEIPFDDDCLEFRLNFYFEGQNITKQYFLQSLFSDFSENVYAILLDSNQFIIPSKPTTSNNLDAYDNVVIKYEGKYYSYTSKEKIEEDYGEFPEGDFYENVILPASQRPYNYNSLSYQLDLDDFVYSFYYSRCVLLQKHIREYNYVELEGLAAGSLVLDVSDDFVDEPFTILVVPLYDVIISGNGTYNISKKNAFSIFNSVINSLSGENSYIVDAQIFPYCPVLTGVHTEIGGIPFFSINATTYEHLCEVNLLPYSDVKKEYIMRNYSIISPEQGGKFTFDFYDYTKKIVDLNGHNQETLKVKVKTALKPFSIISSCVIQPSLNSLYGITYPSDLRGCQPLSNGFECSLSSNAFETYKRQNSNYKQFFELDKGELSKQHEVERVNETVGGIVNTISATSMAALAGASMADVSHIAKADGAAGAAVAGAAAGVTVGVAMALQKKANDELRNYETQLQQQRFDLTIGTIKNLPNSVNRISSFNEIIIKDFCYCVEIYECSEEEKTIVDNFINNYGYSIGVFDLLSNYQKDGWFLRSTLVSSNYSVNLHLIAEKELMGGIYLYEQK